MDIFGKGRKITVNTFTKRTGRRHMEDEMRKADDGQDIQSSGKRYQIDLERFGIFVSRLRGEKGMTQKALAEKLFVSDKAVSKWENGKSLPDISLLEPLAQMLGVTVPELLHGKRLDVEEPVGGQQDELFTEENLKKWFSESDAAIRAGSSEMKQRKRRGIRLYIASILLSGVEILLLYLLGVRLGMGGFDVSMEVLLTVGLVLMFGPWFFWIMPECLPSYYDVMSLSYFAYGGMHINLPGVRFNNMNWPHILKAWRTFGFWVPVGWPVCWTLLWTVFRYQPLLEMKETDFSIVVLLFRVLMPLAVILGGLFVPTYRSAKKYGNSSAMQE